MSELANILIAANRRFVGLQLDHATRTGSGQLVAFERDVELTVETYQRKLDDFATQAVDVSATRSALLALANAVTTAAKARGFVEVPAAA